MKNIFLFLLILASSHSFTQKNIDSILKKKLELIEIEDQTLRKLLPDVTKRFGKNSNEKNYFWSLIRKQDSICTQKISKIIDTYGWVGKSRIGEKANQTLWLVIQHADISIQEKYLPLLKRSVSKGESQGWHLAFLQDRILVRNKKKQLYGTQVVWDKKLKKMKIYPVKDFKNVNNRRKKLGLSTIEEHAKYNNAVITQE